MKVTIDGINRNTKETKFGEKRSVGIQIVEQTVTDLNGESITVGGKWLNCLYDLKKDNGSEGWSKGDVVNISIKKNGEYLNFSPIQAGDNADLADRVAKLEAAVFGGGAVAKPASNEPTINLESDF